MALPTNSAGPDAPTDSTAIDGLLGLGLDAQEIRNWLVALSPSGGVYDTGWVAVTPSSGVTAAQCQVRRRGKRVTFRMFTASFATLATGASLKLVDALPAGFAPSSSTRCAAYLTAGRIGIAGAGPDGSVSVWNQTGTNVTSAQVYCDWLVD